MSNRRGQAEFKVVAALLNVSAVTAIAQAVAEPLHVIPDAIWHAGTWVVALLVAVLAFFGRRLLVDIEHDIAEARKERHRIEAELRQCMTKLAVMESMCAMRHGGPIGGETRP